MKDVFHTCAMSGSSTWSDHRLVRCKLAFKVRAPRHRHRLKPQRKPDVSKLKSQTVRSDLVAKLQEASNLTDVSRLGASASWEVFKDIIQKVSVEVLGYPERKHRDWFDEHDPLIRPMLTRVASSAC